MNFSTTKGINLDSRHFFNMSNLRVLKFYIPKIVVHMSIEEELLDSGVQLPDGLDYVPKKLRYFHWHKYQLRTMPSNFKSKNLIELNLPFSRVTQIWEGKKGMLCTNIKTLIFLSLNIPIINC